MAFPILPLLLLGAAIGGGALLVKSAGRKGAPGLSYGPNCSWVKVIDQEAYGSWMVSQMEKFIAFAKSIDASSPAEPTVRKAFQLMIPGPGCSWATDGSFDCELIRPDGDSMRYSQILAKIRGKTAGEANDILEDLVPHKQGSSGSVSIIGKVALLIAP